MRNFSMLQRKFLLTLLSLWLWSPMLLAEAADTTSEYFTTYEDLQKKLVVILGEAKQKIWIASRWLNDQRITDALFSAHHRKVEVKLLLGSSEKLSLNGRTALMEFQAEKIAFALDRHLRAESTTAILLDQHLLWVNAIMDEMPVNKQYSLQYLENAGKIKSFATYFETHSIQASLASNLDETKKREQASAPKSEWDQLPKVFDYRKHAEGQPAEVNKNLPKMIKWKNKTGSF